MHVTIERKYEKVGFFLGVHYFITELAITFTETELAAIENAKLQPYAILDRGEWITPYRHQDLWQYNQVLKVGNLVHIHKKQKPERVSFTSTQPDADAAEETIRENLKKLKSQIEAALKEKPAKDSFEL
jgi:hypothetical protein